MSKYPYSIFDKETPHIIVMSRILGSIITVTCLATIYAVLFL